MGCCCAKKKDPESVTDTTRESPGKKSSSSSGKKGSKCMGGDDDTTEKNRTNSLSNIDEYHFNSTRDDWKLTEAKSSIDPNTIEKLENNVDFEVPTKTPPANQISNVILFDTKTGSEVVKKLQERPDLLKASSSAKVETYVGKGKKGGPVGKITISSSSKAAQKKNASKSPKRNLKVSTSASQDTSQAVKDELDEDSSMKTEVFKTKVDGVEKIAVVFSTEKQMNPEDMQHVLSGFIENVQQAAPQIFAKPANDKPSIAFAYDSGRPIKKPPKVPRREIVRQV